MAGKLSAVTQTDFSGGINAVSSPYILQPKQVFRARNMVLGEQGALTTRDGYSPVTTSPVTTQPLLYIGVLNKSDATSVRYAIQTSTGVGSAIYSINTTPWTFVGNFLTNYTTPQSVTALDQDIIAAGYEVPWIFNGTTLTNITSVAGQTTPPGANHIAFHLGSIWLWNTSLTTSSLDGPSSIRMSDINNPNSWPNANQTFISENDGQVGMGMATFTIAETGISPTQTLIAFKNYSTYQINSVFGASNFAIQRVKSDMGCVAPRPIQFLSGIGMIRLTHKGLAIYNGVDDKIVSEEIRPYIFGGEEIQPLNQTALGLSWAAQSQSRLYYVAACPVVGKALTRIFVYDLIRKAWVVCDFPISFSCMSLIATNVTFPVIYAGTNTGGQIVSIFNGDTTDAGAPIQWSFRTKTFAQKDNTQPAFWKRGTLDLVFQPPTQTVSVSTSLANIVNPLSENLNYSGAVTGVTTYGSAKYGSGVYSSASSVELENRKSFTLMRTSPSLFSTFTGAGRVSVL